MPDPNRGINEEGNRVKFEKEQHGRYLRQGLHLRRLKPDLYPRPVIRHNNPQPFILSLPTNGLYARLDEISAVFLDPVSAGSRHAVIGRTSRRTS